MDHNWWEIKKQGEYRRQRYLEEARRRHLMRTVSDSPPFSSPERRELRGGIIWLGKILFGEAVIDRAGPSPTPRRSGSAHAS
jgi:hypothetical protein